MFGGLLSLLRVLDENAFNKIIQDATELKLSPKTLSVMNSTKRFSSKNYRVLMFRHIEIYEDKTLSESFLATDYGGQWLNNVSEEDLIGIPRVYIEAENSETRYLGTYEPYIACVKLTWQ